MAFESLMRRVQTMKENRAVAGTPAAEVAVTRPTAESLATNRGVSFADRFKARFMRGDRKISAEEMDPARETARQTIEGNQLLGDAAKRVAEHDKQAEVGLKATEVAVKAGDKLRVLTELTKQDLDLSKLSSEALDMLADTSGEDGMDINALFAERRTNLAVAAQAEKDRRVVLGDLPNLSIDAERSHVEQAEKAQAEMIVYGKRVTTGVEIFGNVENQGHRILGDVDKITAANVLLKNEGPNVVLLRKAETDFVQQLQRVAQLQARRDGTPEDQQEELERIVYKHTEARRQIRELAAKAQPHEGYGQRCAFSEVDKALTLGASGIANEQFTSLSHEGKTAVLAQFGEVAEDDDRKKLKPVAGTLVAEFVSDQAQLGSLTETINKAVQICRQNPEAADALYLIALQEAKLAQSVATKVVKLRTEVKLAVAEQQQKEKQQVAEQANELQKANKARERASKYGKMRLGILGKVKGGIEWVQKRVEKADSKVDDTSASVTDERNRRTAEEYEQVGKVLQKMLELYDEGKLSEDDFMSIVNPLQYQSVKDVRIELGLING